MLARTNTVSDSAPVNRDRSATESRGSCPIPGSISEVVFATDKLTLTVERPITDAQRERYAKYLADQAAWEAEERRLDADYAARVLASLGDRDAAVINVSGSRGNYWELAFTVAGKTAEAVEAQARAYAAEHDGKLPRFGSAEPWHSGFRIIGTRRAQ